MKKRFFLISGVSTALTAATHAWAQKTSKNNSKSKRKASKVAQKRTKTSTQKTKNIAQGLIGIRIWPASDYTRIALETQLALTARHFLLKQPDRLVIDFDGDVRDRRLQELATQTLPNDPFLKSVRVGQFTPTRVRLVFELRQAIRLESIALRPLENYQHRLLFDLYPIAAVETDASSSTANNATNGNDSNNAQTKPANDQPTSSVRPFVIALDPGHGGEDPGAIGPSGTYEKNIVLTIARKLKEQLLATTEINCKVVLTRDGDYFVPLHERVRKARQAQADCFISIHADAFIEPHARGASVFALSASGASSTSAKWLANKENAADLIGGINLKNRSKQLASLLLDLSTTAQIQSSLDLGARVIDSLRDFAALHSKRVEQAGFAVLKAPDIPSILIETGFISNPKEEALLSSSSYQESIVTAIRQALVKFITTHLV